MGLPAYFIQYKFVFPEKTSHASYAYQKLFRALYGYTQAVNKSSGKSYRYPRPGVLSHVPFIRPGKNSVIVPPAALQAILAFFKTGKNPAHNWVLKGPWKAVYYLNEKQVQPEDAITANQELLERLVLKLPTGAKSLLQLVKNPETETIPDSFLPEFVALGKKAVDNEWFEPCAQQLPVLADFKKIWRAARDRVK